MYCDLVYTTRTSYTGVKKSMITILMPVYNGLEYLEESVTSILQQTIPTWTLYIGINGHTRNSETYIRTKTWVDTHTTHDKRIYVLDLYWLKGKAMTLNYMISHCIVNAEWISICDVDDVWFPTKLASQLPYMTENYDVIGTRCVYFGDSQDEPCIPKGDLLAHNFYEYNPIINSSCIVKYRWCVWEELPIDDYDMWLRIWHSGGRFYNVDSVQVKHRLHCTSAFNAQGNDQIVPRIIDKHKKPNITFATCWYPVKAKYNSDVYETWMQNILKYVIGFYLVVYTDDASYTLLDSYIRSHPYVKLVRKPLESFYGYIWKDQWMENHRNNPYMNEQSECNIEWKLNMIWCEKIHMTVEATQYYETDYYGWMDIGYFRDGPVSSSWPSKRVIWNLNRQKIYYAQVCSDEILEHLCKDACTNGETPIPPNQMSIAGGFFITYKTNLMWWYRTFYNRLKMYFQQKRLVKDDQIIILDCIAHHRDRFELVSNHQKLPYSPDRWFIFQPFLSSS
jgi:glycosyltransferase involved in cell wall biosynthesis